MTTTAPRYERRPAGGRHRPPGRTRRSIAALLCVAALCASTSSFSAEPAVLATGRDGSGDFSFKRGHWTTHIRRLLQPLTGSKAWVTLDGVVTVRDVWGGRALLETIDAHADGASASTGRFESLTLFLYNPQARQWSLNFSNAESGRIDTPAIGEFVDGRGVFYDQETFQGRTIQVRIVWSHITAESHRFEQSFSDDGGLTWEVNFVATLTRRLS